MPLLTRRTATAGLLTAAAMTGAPMIVRAADPFRLRLSLDTAPSHGRNKAFTDYLSKVEAASGGRIRTELFPSGQLYADLNVTKALIQGEIEMASPGIWAITNFIQDADVFQLPVLYNQPIEVIHRVTDGKTGAMINAEVQEKLRSHVLGPWLDNGFSNWFTTRTPLHTLADLKGLKIRNSGGTGQSLRTEFFGAIPNVTSWPNVPLALSQNTFDGLIASDDSTVSATLWESGIRYGYEDHNFFGAYVPMIANAFWTKLPADLQAMMTETWAKNVGAYRSAMAEGQARAFGVLQSHGVTIVVPSPEQAAATRKALMADEDKVAKALKLNPEIVKLARQDVGGTA
jgi:C4-dicarboxylate-binding protein DctP